MKYGITNAKGVTSNGGSGGHANLRTYDASIIKDQNEPNTYHLDLSQAYIVDLATGMPPTSYNTGDIVYACMPDGNNDDEIENIYVVNRVDNTTDLILQSKMPVRHLILTTTTDATYSNSEYTLAFINLDEMPNIKDYVAYINNGAITTLYQVDSIDWQNEQVVLTKIGDIGGGGKQLYQHNIFLAISGTSNFAYFNITNDNDNEATTINDIMAMFIAKGITTKQKAITCTGRIGGNSISCVWAEDNYLRFITSDTTGSSAFNSAYSLKDTATPL